jgi:hypothetical protein
MPYFRFRCCKHPPGPRFLEFSDETGVGQCPQCGAKHGEGFAVYPLIDIHFMVLGEGPIVDSSGRQHVACQPARDGLSQSKLHEYAATLDPRVATCPSCRGTPEWQQAAAWFAETDRLWAKELRELAAAKPPAKVIA